jgi:hypothetical protein
VTTDLFDSDHATLSPTAHDDAGVKWTEDAMLRHLWRHFVAQSWAGVPQVTVALRDLDPSWYRLTQEEREHADEEAQRDAQAELGGCARPVETPVEERDRRIDLLLLRPPRKEGLGDLETIAVEVKVTRADFLADIRQPWKQAPWRQATTRHAYAVPQGLVLPSEVPAGSGLLYVTEDASGWGHVEWEIRAPYRQDHAPSLPRRVLVALSHRIGQLEAANRAWNTTPAAAGSEQEVRAALNAANKAADRANGALERALAQKDAWKTAYALLSPNGHPCMWCGHGVKPLNPHNGWFRKWRHLDADLDAACKELEAASITARARKEYAAAEQVDRDRALRHAHYRHPGRFDAAAEAEPWRAFIPRDPYGVLQLSGAAPANILPDGTPESVVDATPAPE